MWLQKYKANYFETSTANLLLPQGLLPLLSVSELVPHHSEFSPPCSPCSFLQALCLFLGCSLGVPSAVIAAYWYTHRTAAFLKSLSSLSCYLTESISGPACCPSCPHLQSSPLSSRTHYVLLWLALWSTGHGFLMSVSSVFKVSLKTWSCFFHFHICSNG